MSASAHLIEGRVVDAAGAPVRVSTDPAALALASEEVVERFRRQISTVVVRRLAAVSRQLADHAPPAVRARRAAPGSFDMQLLDN